MAKAPRKPAKSRPAKTAPRKPKVSRLYDNLRAAIIKPSLRAAIDRNTKAADALDAAVKEMLKQ